MSTKGAGLGNEWEIGDNDWGKGHTGGEISVRTLEAWNSYIC